MSAKLTTNAKSNAAIVGTGTELANDDSWAEFRIYTRGHSTVIRGTPRELRRVFKAGLEGLTRSKEFLSSRKSLTSKYVFLM